MAGTTRPGEGELFTERFDLNELDTIRHNEHRGFEYRIIKRYRRTQDGNLIPTHYTGYVKIPEEYICSCGYCLEKREIPPSPGNYGMNFGPTEDNWIGFGTAEPTDYNFDSDMTAFTGDTRTDIDPEHRYNDIQHHTPEILVSEILQWIEDIESHLENYACHCQD